MRKSWILVGAATLGLAACGQPGDEAVYESADAVAEAPANEFGFMEAEEAGPAAERVSSLDIKEPSSAEQAADGGNSVPEGAGNIAVSTPQIAYRYEKGFRLPAAAIKPLQEKHADMCEARGPSVCRIISMRQADSDGDYAYGNLQIAVAAAAARDFGKQLEASSEGADAELVSSSIEGEDLSKAIVDTEARLRARTVLRDRLMEVLRTRKGTVAELVQAERGVAQVNQEIDQAQSWLTEMRGRVAFSQMSVSYESGSRSSGGFTDPIRGAWNSLGGIFGSMIAFLILAIAVLGPIGIVLFAAFKLWRWIKRSERSEPDAVETVLEPAADPSD